MPAKIIHGYQYTTNTGIPSGIIDNNYNAHGELAIGSLNQVGKWRRMEQTCSPVSIGMRSLINMLQGVKWSFCGNDVNEKIIEFLDEAFFGRLERQFSDVVASLLRAVANGISPQEIVLQNINGKIMLYDIAYRPPQSFVLNDTYMRDDGWIEAVQEVSASQNGCSYTPRKAYFGGPGESNKGWLLWPIFGDSGSILGEGIYRPIFPIFEEWETAMKLRRVAIQKCSLGAPVVYRRQGVGAGDGTDKDDWGTTLDEVAAVISHQQSALGMPEWVEKIEWTYTNPEAIRVLTETISDCEVRMLMSFQAQAMARGTLTAHGTNSANESDSEQQAVSRQYYINWISRSLQPVIDYLIDENFGEQKEYPELTGEIADKTDPFATVNALISAKNSELLILDKQIRDNVRALLGQEPEGDEVEAALAEKEQNKLEIKEQTQESEEEPEEEAEEEAEFAAVRAAPKPGGQNRRTGPNGRDLSRCERLVRWDTIAMTLDNGSASLQQAAMEARNIISNDMLKNINVEYSTTGQDIAEQLRKYRAKAKIKKQVEKLLSRQIEHVADVATDSIDSEYEQQTEAQQFASFANGDTAKKQQKLYTDMGVDDAFEDTKNQLLRASISISAPSGQQIMALLKDASNEFSKIRAKEFATMATTEVFARARVERVGELVRESARVPKNVWYSAVLDNATCGECVDADQRHGEATGEPIKWDSAEMTEYMPPYQRCLGGALCRCQLIMEW